MIKRFIVCATMACSICGNAQASFIGVCDLNAVAFANPAFNTVAAAQKKCDELVDQTGGDAADCKVVRGAGNKKVAQFRKRFALQQVDLNTVLRLLGDFVVTNNIFSSSQIKLQAAVSNGCK